MSHTFTNLLYHIVFSTKNHEPFIDAELKPRLHGYMDGIAKELSAKPFVTNGTADHAHSLVAAPPNLCVSDLLRVLKTNSSRWVHEQFPNRAAFAWQAGYGAFTVSKSNCDAVFRYITNQEPHHRGMTFQEEFPALLKKHGIEYDERYIWE